MLKPFRLVLSLLVLWSCDLAAQDILLYDQLNGKIDFKLIGNTLNPIENSNQKKPEILSNSSAMLTLLPKDVIKKAYLYWAGSGTGDFDISLNEQNFTADRRFSYRVNYPNRSFNYFSAFKDITPFVQATGVGNYTFSNLDVSAFLEAHFEITTNFAGWAIIIIYENPSLTVNQINVYDGLKGVPNAVSISLNSLNIIDNLDSKIGFISWEGDRELAENETLKINNQILSNLPLNPANNAFNGTFSELGTSNLYNMDLDIYPVENNIQIGDQSALIQLTSSRDFVLINTIITKFNSRLPDATIGLNSVAVTCNSRTVVVDYKIANLESIEILPAQTPIAFYANSVLVGRSVTRNPIAIGGFENGQLSVLIPEGLPTTILLKAVVDDLGTGFGIVSEINEINNSATNSFSFFIPPLVNALSNLQVCNQGLGKGTFNFMDYEDLVKTNPLHTVSFYESRDDATLETNAIVNASSYEAATTPKTIYVRVNDAECYTISTFDLTTNNCPPTTIYNYISANGDATNSTFFIEGLRDVFVNFRTEIYNRWGKLVWVGTNALDDWDGLSNQPIRLDNSTTSPSDTYFYIVYLNDPDYPEPLVGYLYLFKRK